MINKEITENLRAEFSLDKYQQFVSRLESELYFKYGRNPIRISYLPIILREEAKEKLFTATNSLLKTIISKQYKEKMYPHIPDQFTSKTNFFDNPLSGGFDFHISDEKPWLIEYMVLPPGMIAFYARFSQLYNEYLGSPFPEVDILAFEQAFLRSFIFQEPVAITDLTPQQQITYPEFLYTQHLLREKGIESKIIDARELQLIGQRITDKKNDFTTIYNRVTLHEWKEMNKQGELLDYTSLFNAKPESFSPNPLHWYLGDKESLITLAQLHPDIVPPTDHTLDIKIDEFNGWILKPLSSFGGRQVYINPSQRKLDELKDILSEFVIQKEVSAPTIPMPEKIGEMKFDIRIFVLEGEAQFACGRVYRGEKTNRHDPGSGFAPIFWMG